MPLTLRYSLQESPLKPKGVTGEYARLQVDLRSEQHKIVISNSDYQSIINAISEGRLIGLQTESGLNIGQFVTGLAGGVKRDEFISAKKSDVRVSFKATKKFLGDVRNLVAFEQVPTVINSPIINGFTFVKTATSAEYINEIPLDSLGFLKIMGTHFIKNSMTATIEQNVGKKEGITQVVLNIVDSGVKYINVVLPNLITPFSVGTATLTVRRKDSSNRLTTMNFEIVA